MKTTSTKHRTRMTRQKLEEERKLQEKAKNVLIVLIVLALLAIAFYCFWCNCNCIWRNCFSWLLVHLSPFVNKTCISVRTG